MDAEPLEQTYHLFIPGQSMAHRCGLCGFPRDARRHEVTARNLGMRVGRQRSWPSALLARVLRRLRRA